MATFSASSSTTAAGVESEALTRRMTLSSLEHGPRSFTAAADRDRLARRGMFVSGAWQLTAEGRRLAGNLKNRDVAVFAAGWQARRGAGTDEEQAPVGDHDRSEVADSDGSPNGGLLATIGYGRTKLRRVLQPAAWGRESLVSAMCAGTRSVASGDSRSDFSPKAVRSLASGMSPFQKWASNPNTAPTLATGQRTIASLPGTMPQLCRAAGTPWAESRDGSRQETGWRSPATNAIHGIAIVPASPQPSSRPPPSP